MFAVLERNADGTVRIGGQYWDAIIWAQGAWTHFNTSHDRAFLGTAFEAIKNSLTRFESEEFDLADGLFRGGACFLDGVAVTPAITRPEIRRSAAFTSGSKSRRANVTRTAAACRARRFRPTVFITAPISSPC
ncbi:MAG: hypothetical protein WC205_03635 [Opitutaceae bacterium]